MSHMGTSGAGCSSAICSGSARIITYTATGAEGTDFMVDIGTTLAADDYTLLWAPQGVTNVPVLDLPTALAGDRTTTQFRVTTADVLTAGDLLVFFLYEA